MENQIQRHLKTEEFYQEIIALIPEETLKKISETTVRGKLDAILTMGKIEGRMSAPISLYGDRLIQDWMRIVEAE